MTTLNRAERAKAKTDEADLPPIYTPEEWAQLEVVPVDLPPSLRGGGRITMRRYTTKVYLGMRRKLWSDLQMIEGAVAAIVEFLPGQDPLDWSPSEIFDLINAWIEAQDAAAIPPTTAAS